MTNREYLIKALSEEFDDFAIEESAIVYSIRCPYYSFDKRRGCNNIVGMPNDWEHCLPCKLQWLEDEVDE